MLSTYMTDKLALSKGISKFSDILLVYDLVHVKEWKLLTDSKFLKQNRLSFTKEGNLAKAHVGKTHLSYNHDTGIMTLTGENEEQFRLLFFRKGIVIFQSLDDGARLALLNRKQNKFADMKCLDKYLEEKFLKDCNHPAPETIIENKGFEKEQKLLIAFLLLGIVVIYAITNYKMLWNLLKQVLERFIN